MNTLINVRLRFHGFAHAATWTAKIPSLTEQQLTREVQRNGRLMSRSWNALFTPDSGRGVVLVGGVRVAGRIHAVCRSCDRDAVCIGEYETDSGDEEYACGECCGHGNEDGHCTMLETEGS